MTGFLERFRAGETLVGDGAWGTMLMARGLRPGESPEALNLSDPTMLAEIAQLYLEVGADLITTNTFGASALNLRTHGLEDQIDTVNRAAVEAVALAVGGRGYISGSVGPSSRLLTPYGDTEPEEVMDSFVRQVGPLFEAGVDVICIETMIDLREAALAISAVRSVSREIPIIATMTFNPTPRGFFTAMGETVERAAAGLEEAGADVVGSNCGNGIDRMVEIAREFKSHSSLPVIIQSNAGLPEQRNGELFFPETPDFMASRVDELVDLGVAVIGGCCGTGPEHIREFRAAVDRRLADGQPTGCR